MSMSENQLPEVECHPLEPFLPKNAVLLMLGSFPPAEETLEHGFLLSEPTERYVAYFRTYFLWRQGALS